MCSFVVCSLLCIDLIRVCAVCSGETVVELLMTNLNTLLSSIIHMAPNVSSLTDILKVCVLRVLCHNLCLSRLFPCFLLVCSSRCRVTDDALLLNLVLCLALGEVVAVTTRR